ncbi:MAG: hypothetical protein KJZ65_03460 [Phycisphaerales bacterium]|nr:hypothetical protein [Phycisphaerales bacterium]
MSNCCNGGSCGPGVSRRGFMGASVGAWLLASAGRAFAGPFEQAADGEHPIPADKKLNEAWVRSLYERGEPMRCRGQELAFIGMPVGGVCCGTMYLGGDGRLWVWDIFNEHHLGVVANRLPEYRGQRATELDGSNYFAPPNADEHRPVGQGFALRVGDDVRTLDKEGFSEVEFESGYPIGTVRYRDDGCPVAVKLEAFSPFIPLDVDASAIPCTIMSFELHNTSEHMVQGEMAGWLENAVAIRNGAPGLGVRRVRPVRRPGLTSVAMDALPQQWEKGEEVLFADFEQETWPAGWVAQGEAMGTGPIARAEMPAYHNVSEDRGLRSVNTHNTRAVGPNVGAADNLKGTLTSPEFTIEKRFINMMVGGGRHPGKTCINLLVDGNVVRTATGRDSNRMSAQSWEVSDLAGKKARIEIVDDQTGAWGHIACDHIVFADAPWMENSFEQMSDYGSMALSLVGDAAASVVSDLDPGIAVEQLWRQPSGRTDDAATRDFGRRHAGALLTRVRLEPGEKITLNYVVSWFFPFIAHDPPGMHAINDMPRLNRHYAERFTSAWDVAGVVARDFERLTTQTRLFHKTWYDTTLPHWLLERTLLTVNTAQTTTCHLFDNGRFWAWEGVGCCHGTCQHVWNYGQALARIFPDLERRTREMVDFGLAWHDNGATDYRAEYGRHVAHDGQLGTILRAYREHQMSTDEQFLKRIWSRVRKSLEYVIAQDADADGLLEGEQYNTLDASWFGNMAWISSMYLAAVAAGREMALDVGDVEFIATCDRILEVGRKSLVEKLYDGDYFIHTPPDFEHPNTNKGCHADQLFGQSYAHQLGLPRVADAERSRSALRSIWTYNFAPDAGKYRERTPVKGGDPNNVGPGRWYALPGEAGLIVCTWPKGGGDKSGNHWAVGYFNECWTGFEYQVASHMIYEGEPDLVQAGLAITRAAHDRYHPSKRNPYNEIECSDHYARAMASFGVYLACCGYEHHGPRGHIGFAPRINTDDFSGAFTAAGAWGTFTQRRTNGEQALSIEVKWGELSIRTIAMELGEASDPSSLAIDWPGGATFERQGQRLLVRLRETARVRAGERLVVVVRT